MPFWGKKKDPGDFDNKGNDDIFLRRQCKYIGSFAVGLSKVEDRQIFVNEQLREFKSVRKGVKVVIQVTSDGIKILDESEKAVKMAHSITRIAFSTCNPDSQLFAYIARSSQLSMGFALQAHVFRTKKPVQAQELGALVTKAFRIAYKMATMKREALSRAFEDEAEKEKVKMKQDGKRRWAKQEIAKGHELSEHAERARRKYGSPTNSPRAYSFDSHPVKRGSSTPELIRPHDVSPPRARAQSQISSRSVLPGQMSPSEQGRRTPSPPPLPARNPQLQSLANADHHLNLESISVSDVATEPVYAFADGKEATGTESLDGISGISDVSQVDEDHVLKEPRKISAPAKLGNLVTDEDLLQDSAWYQGGLSREIAEEILKAEIDGAFLVRDSQSQPGFYALSIRVPENIKQDGIANYLIEKTPSNLYQIMGFQRTFETLPRLIVYYAINKEDLPVKLRLASNNPLFAVALEDDMEDDPDYQIFDSCENILNELQGQNVK